LICECKTKKIKISLIVRH